MPGIVVFRRRWSVGSDDFVVPGVVLAVVHAIWLVVLAVMYGMIKGETICWKELGHHVVGYLVILSGCLVLEILIAVIAMRGTILDATPRASMQYLVYVRLVLFIAEVVWLILGVVWLLNHEKCASKTAKDAILGIVICNWCVVVSVVITVWCTFDAAGRSWVKMKRYQRSMRDSNSKFQYRRSGNRQRNWRQRDPVSPPDKPFSSITDRNDVSLLSVADCDSSSSLYSSSFHVYMKVLRAYQDSWDHRCRVLFCCLGKKDRNSSSFSDIARLLSEFFRDLDVVPSDVVAGLVLLRKYQKEESRRIVASNKNDVIEFLSGVPITPRTRFLQLSTPEGHEEFTKIVHYMKFAMAVYGWPMYIVMASSKGICKPNPFFCCSCCQCRSYENGAPQVVEDNFCKCNAEALLRMSPSEGVDLVFVTYHVDVGEPPFFVALDHIRKAIVISVRGTLSMKDVITDLNAESEPLPMDTIREDWFGHKGMVSAAEYIRRKLKEDNILGRAFAFDLARGSNNYDLVLVGHSLGAGTASILSILLRQDHPNLCCFAYSPPGGLLSMPAVEYTKGFITSVVMGKDVVPRIGLHQMEALRADLISAIQRSQDPKWKTIASSFQCCSGAMGEMESDGEAETWSSSRAQMRDQASHPSDSSIALTVHPPLFPPGRILHIVRNHPKKEQQQKYDVKSRRWCKPNKPVYQAVWVDNRDFDEVLISPCMVQDHMPDNLLDALEQVLENPGPPKPQRQTAPDASDFTLSSHTGREESSENNFLLSHSATTPTLAASQLTNTHTFESFTSTPAVAALTTSSTVPEIPQLSESKLSKGSTPPHKLLLETSFTCSPMDSPGPRPDLRNHINIHGLTWEILSALEDQLLVGAAMTHLPEDDWMGQAPLASPETLSEVSSVASRASLILRDGNRNSSVFPTIHHSPVLAPRANSRSPAAGYCYFVSTPPARKRRTILEEIISSSEEEEEDNETPEEGSCSPSSFITLYPILPKSDAECKSETSTNKSCENDFAQSLSTSKEIVQTSSEERIQQEPAKVHFQFGVSKTFDSDSNASSSSTSSSIHDQEKVVELVKSSSQMSRDSGYGERVNGVNSKHASIPSNLDWNYHHAANWPAPQQEYGRGPPPLTPHYLYASFSPQLSPPSNSSDGAGISPQMGCRDAGVTFHPLHKATPLLHGLTTTARKASIGPSESSV